MSWWSTAFDWTKEVFENEVVKDITSVAVGIAGSYAVNEFMADRSTPLLTDSSSLLKGDTAAKASATEATKPADDEIKARRGRASTILTGPQGLVDDDEVDIKKRTLLGG